MNWILFKTPFILSWQYKDIFYKTKFIFKNIYFLELPGTECKNYYTYLETDYVFIPCKLHTAGHISLLANNILFHTIY